MYLEHFKINEYPFSLTPNTEFFCELTPHIEALNVLLVSLKSGEGFIKITGEVGTGKTLLCRLLLLKIREDYTTAYIPNPDLNPDSLRLTLAQELGISDPGSVNSNELLQLINEKLLSLYEQQKPVILIIDEAQALSDAALEAIRLLTNLETEKSKLVQVVLFGQPELNDKLNKPSLRQLKQRITFSYHLSPMKEQELKAYLFHRLAKAGYTYGNIFTPKACKLLHKATRGLPRLVNVICHKSMMAAYGQGKQLISPKAVKQAIKDTDSLKNNLGKKPWWFWFIDSVIIMGLGVMFYLLIRQGAAWL